MAGGGCLCGRVRFEASGPALSTGWCHCRMCQRSSGAPAQTWAAFPHDRVRWSAEPAAYRSSPGCRRLFCPDCGSQLGFDDGSDIALNTGCFDEPGAFPPERHIWCSSRVAWFEAADGLPRHEQEG